MMLRARTEFSLKNADDIFNPKIETKTLHKISRNNNNKGNEKAEEKETQNERNADLCVCVCAVLKVGELLLADLTKYFTYLERVRAIATSRHIKDSPSILLPK